MSFDYPYDLRFNLCVGLMKIHVHRYIDKFANPDNYK